jgi:hypothetical protein
MSSLDRRGSGSGSLVSSYASRSHREQEEAQARLERGDEANSSSEPQYPVRLPTDAGVAHVPANLTDGMVVDPRDKVSHAAAGGTNARADGRTAAKPRNGRM